MTPGICSLQLYVVCNLMEWEVFVLYCIAHVVWLVAAQLSIDTFASKLDESS